MSKATMLAVLSIIMLPIAACGGSGAGSVGEEVADFSLATLEGDEFRLADKRGEVVALFFMAGW